MRFLAGRNKASGEPEAVNLVAGSLPVDTPAFIFKKYKNATHTYYCKGPVGANLSDPVWRITRRTNADTTLIPAGNGQAEYAATDLSTVVGHQYVMGL